MRSRNLHELTRVYSTDKISSQYKAFASVTGIDIVDSEEKAEADEAIARLKKAYPDLVFNIGECTNANAFELALSLTRMGFKVDEIYAALAPENFVYVKNLALLSPDTKIYCNMEPGEGKVKILTINGIAPTSETIADGSYPIAGNIYAIYRKGETNENVKKAIDFMLSPEGQEIVERSGYIPLS